MAFQASVNGGSARPFQQGSRGPFFSPYGGNGAMPGSHQLPASLGAATSSVQRPAPPSVPLYFAGTGGPQGSSSMRSGPPQGHRENMSGIGGAASSTEPKMSAGGGGGAVFMPSPDFSSGGKRYSPPRPVATAATAAPSPASMQRPPELGVPHSADYPSASPAPPEEQRHARGGLSYHYSGGTSASTASRPLLFVPPAYGLGPSGSSAGEAHAATEYVSRAAVAEQRVPPHYSLRHSGVSRLPGTSSATRSPPPGDRREAAALADHKSEARSYGGGSVIRTGAGPNPGGGGGLRRGNDDAASWAPNKNTATGSAASLHPLTRKFQQGGGFTSSSTRTTALGPAQHSARSGGQYPSADASKGAALPSSRSTGHPSLTGGTNSPSTAAPSVARTGAKTHVPPETYGAKEILFARLQAKILSPHRIVKDPQSQTGALCISPKSQLAYKIIRVLQSAIYGGVFEAEAYSIARVLKLPGGHKPVPIKSRVALKVMLRALEVKHTESLEENIVAETEFESVMRGHRNVLCYDELWESHSKGIIYVVMPFAEFEDLFEVLKKRQCPFGESEARWLFRQLLEGAHFLHARGIGFRDHSLENILMFRSQTDGKTIIPRITDPGQAIRIDYDADGKVLPRRADKLFGKSFRPPEVYEEPRMYDPVKVDAFCLGWMLFFVVTKRQPFDRAVDTDPHWPYVKNGRMGELVKLKGGSNNLRLSQDLLSLLSWMMHSDYRQRPNLEECLAHPWFKHPETPITDRIIRGPPANKPATANAAGASSSHHHHVGTHHRPTAAAGTGPAPQPPSAVAHC